MKNDFDRAKDTAALITTTHPHLVIQFNAGGVGTKNLHSVVFVGTGISLLNQRPRELYRYLRGVYDGLNLAAK